MSYKIPKLTDKKKLCPRCGSPMMDKSETLKYCPVCHFSESTLKSELKINIEEESEASKTPEIELLKVTKTGISIESSLESEYSFVVVDRKANTLWIWKGSKSSPGDAYKAGVETTKLKSSLKMYSAQIKRVEEGDEPAEFPSLKEGVELAKAEEKVKDAEVQKVEADQQAKLERERNRKEEEAERARMDAEQQARLEEEQKRKEEEERRYREEQEKKRKEAEERRQAEVESQKMKDMEEMASIWNKVAMDTKSIPEEGPSTKEEAPKVVVTEPESPVDDTELNEAISSLTLVRGITKEIAKALYRANITTIMELSLGNIEEIAVKSGLPLEAVQEIVQNAKDLLGFD